MGTEKNIFYICLFSILAFVLVFFSGCTAPNASFIGSSSPIEISQYNQLASDANMIGLSDGFGVLNYVLFRKAFFDYVSDLNYGRVVNSDYNGMLLIFNGSQLSVASPQDLNVSVDLNGYVTIVYADNTYAFKGDVNSWGDQRYYSITNPSNFITISALSPYITKANADTNYYPLNSNPAGYLTTATIDSNCAVNNSCPNIVYWQDANTVFVKQVDGNNWYVLKESFPNLIYTEAQFLAMNPYGSYFLANDITISFSYAGTFYGSFNGNGKTITLNCAGSNCFSVFNQVSGSVNNFAIDATILYDAPLTGFFSSSCTQSNLNGIVLSSNINLTNNISVGCTGIENECLFGNTQCSNNSTPFVYKSDFNSLGDARYYQLTNPAGYITTANLSGYLTEIDANLWFYKRTDFNYLTFLTNETDPVFNAWLSGYTPTIDTNWETSYVQFDTNIHTYYPKKSLNEIIEGQWNFSNGLDINGGFSSGGTTISNGVVYTKSLVLLNDINSYNITTLDINGGLIPYINQVFDLGTNTKQWNKVYAKEYYGDGNNLTNVIHIESDPVWLNDKGNYLLQIDGNNLYAFKSDVNLWGDARYYSVTNPNGYITTSALTPYTLQVDGNSWYYKKEDFNYLTFLTNETDPVFTAWDFNYLKLKYKPSACSVGYALSSLDGTCVSLPSLTGYLTKTDANSWFARLDSSNHPFFTFDIDGNHVISLDTFNREGRDSTNTSSFNWDSRSLHGFWTVGGNLQVNGNNICDSSSHCYSFNELLYDTNWQTSFTVFDANMKATYVSHQQLDSNLDLYVSWIDGNNTYYKKTDIVFPLVDANITDLNYNKLFGFPNACPIGYALQAFDGTCVQLSSLTGYLTEVDGNAWYVKKTDFNSYMANIILDYYTITDTNNLFVKKTDFNSYLNPQACPIGFALQTLGSTPTCVALPAVLGFIPYVGATQDLNTGKFNIDTNEIYTKVIWSDFNRGYGTLYCIDGNIFMGYVRGKVC